MILSFSFSNFRSVKEECNIDFRKANIKQHIDTLINDSILPVSVLYGPNGGGKSTVIYALQYLCSLIATPINQFKGFSNLEMPTFKPFMLDKDSKNKPSEFCILFNLDMNSKIEYRYYVSVLKGRIVEESLYEKDNRKPAMIFERNYNEIINGKKYSLISNNQTSEINPNMPYLSMCAILFSNSTIGKIGSWFTKVGVLDFGNPQIEIAMPMLFATLCQDKEIKENMDELLKEFNLMSKYKIKDVINPINGQKEKMLETYHKVGNSEYVLNYTDESMGTKKVMQMLPSITMALKEGNLVCIDELDAKIHPKLLEFVISLFTNKNVNKKGAQLVFTSHDMYTLNSNVFRRDEIWFACKNDEESTIVYSLSDIKGEDNRKLRSDLTFSKQYLQGRYGADPYYNKLLKWEDLNA